MKQLLNKCLVMVVMFTTIESYSHSFTLQTNEQGKKVTAVSIDSVDEGSLFLIKDSYGVILYKEQIEETGTYSKNFDLTSLPDADYYFELDKQDEIKIIPFVVKKNVAEFVKNAEYNIVKPKVLTISDRVYISQISIDKQTWEIDVYYEGSDLAHTEKLKNVQELNRIYDFSTSQKGNYTIVLTSEGRTFKNNVKIP